MIRDPIVDEVRNARDVVAKKYDYDVKRIVEAMKQQSISSGIKAVSLPPKQISKTNVGRKSA